MATRSTITVKTGKNERKSIYAHWDGSPSWNGKILLEHYNTQEKVEELISYGNVSVLAPKIHPDPNRVHTFDNKQDDVCVFYGRDRGDRGQDAEVLTNARSVDEQEFNYYFVDGQWYVKSGEYNTSIRRRIKLTEAVCKAY